VVYDKNHRHVPFGLTGKTVAQAKAMLRAQQCRLGKLSFSRSKLVPHDRVIEAERVYIIEAAHNPEVAGSNPAPATAKGPGNGAFCFPGHLRRYFAALRKAGFPRIRFHDLRHTFAGLLIAQGEHPKLISEQLGHASVQITLDRYGHLMDQSYGDASDRLEAALFAKSATEASAAQS
jgi:integrase